MASKVGMVSRVVMVSRVATASRGPMASRATMDSRVGMTKAWVVVLVGSKAMAGDQEGSKVALEDPKVDLEDQGALQETLERVSTTSTTTMVSKVGGAMAAEGTRYHPMHAYGFNSASNVPVCRLVQHCVDCSS